METLFFPLPFDDAVGLAHTAHALAATGRRRLSLSVLYVLSVLSVFMCTTLSVSEQHFIIKYIRLDGASCHRCNREH